MALIVCTIPWTARAASPHSRSGTDAAAVATANNDFDGSVDASGSSGGGRCAAAQQVVDHYERLERTVDRETELAKRVVDSVLEDAKSQTADKAQEGNLHWLSTHLDRVLAQIRRAETNLASGLWSKATILEQKWVAQSAAVLRFLGEPALKAVARVDYVKMAYRLGRLGTIDILLNRDLGQLESLKADYERAKRELAACSATRTSGDIIFGAGSGAPLGLWITNGTKAGTHEIPVRHGSRCGASDLTTLGHEVLFDTTRYCVADGLWVTNGTAAGTKLISPSVDVDKTNLVTPPIVAIGDRAVLPVVASGVTELWWTDGSTAQPLGVSMNQVSTIAPLHGTGALVGGVDRGGNTALWVTDGTNRGTREIWNAANASPFGEPLPTDAVALTPSTAIFTLFSNYIVNGSFDASSPADGDDIFVATGSSVQQLSDPASDSSQTLDYNIRDITPIEGGALFFDSIGDLWFTNGTSAGTVEVETQNFFSGASDLTPVRGRVLFSSSLDPSEYTTTGTRGSLWTTDGPTAQQVRAADDAMNPYDITVFGSGALFHGADLRGDYGLWLWDGRAARMLTRGGSGVPECRGFPGVAGGGDTYVEGARALFDGPDGGLWITNGTPGGTMELSNRSTIAPSCPYDMSTL